MLLCNKSKSIAFLNANNNLLEIGGFTIPVIFLGINLRWNTKDVYK